MGVNLLDLRAMTAMCLCNAYFLWYDARDGSLARRGIACWSCQLLLDVSNRKASRRAEKKCTQQGKARRINYRGLGSI
ncbi:hypothetical protein L3X38_003375 [Prunus dulcis]|uniref:Uncharacterized protein n=1 Tax=Prunus dulcis TaxID=3755 RepID=A0AAD4ZLZ0_PRUDU|nr:hypothetical protein L3X38_003375 [Prunus dulcis]